MKHAKILRIISFSIIVLFVLFGGASCGTESQYHGEDVLAMTKTASPALFGKVGDVITYTYEIKGIGPHFKQGYGPDITVTNISITDSPLDGPVTCPSSELKIGETMQCTATYTITEQDVINGSVTNNAAVFGDFWLDRDGCSILGGNQVLHQTTASAPGVTVTLDQPVEPAPEQSHPSLTLVKSTDPAVFSKEGQLIKFTFTITNTGDVPIEGLPFILTDSLDVTDINCPEQALAPEESTACTAWYAVKSSDINNPIQNCATMSGVYNDPNAGPQAVESNNGCVDVFYQEPKQGGGNGGDGGDPPPGGGGGGEDNPPPACNNPDGCP